MEATAASHHIPTNLTTLTAKLPPKKTQFLNFTSCSPKKITLFCSTKPNTNNQEATDETNPTSDSHPNSTIQSKSAPIPSLQLSSSSSFSRGLIFDLGVKNSWDNLEIGSPVVKRYLGDEEERWYMWYHGRCSELDSVGLAASSNGIHWERGAEGVRSNADVGLVMSNSKDWWAFDTHGVRPCEVVVMSSAKVRTNSAVYWLYYTGFCSTDSPKSLPGLAMSQDGRHWARIEGEHHSGALLDVGAKGEWDSTFIASPQVVFHGSGDLRMYYHSFDVETGRYAVGIARSRDGMRWMKLGRILSAGPNGAFDEGGVLNPHVLRDRRDGKYVMVYEGVGGERRSIGVAESLDGLKEWRRVGEGPVIEEECGGGGWDSEGVGSPCLVQMDGEAEQWRLYYTGVGRGGKTGIGLAVSQGTQLDKFQRWTGFIL
ncbi:uncharacterized protein LOC130995803 [Salvia miltiorrhiza]|uniref:uncharacterized protein LOC130995803 n=1 Tax=Salvia miltiorrhiza TaxID=226208 RepID=UPI0025AC970A|nr:uncharacterized protein LOC130995803 [Salvia miltiorrhiza]